MFRHIEHEKNGHGFNTTRPHKHLLIFDVLALSSIVRQNGSMFI